MNNSYLKKCTRFVFYALVLNVLCPALMSAACADEQVVKPASNLSYNAIGNLYLSSFGISPVKQEVVPVVTKKGEKPKPRFEMPAFGDRERREIIFKMLSQHEGTVIDSPELLTLVKDLELFVGQGEDVSGHIFNKVNNTVTVFGEIALAHMLANPTTDMALLQKRQALIKELISNQELFNQVEAQLVRAKNAENGFLSFWKEEDQPTREYLDSFYFNKLNLNGNPASLEALTRLADINTVWLLSNELVSWTLSQYGMAQITYHGMKKMGAPEQAIELYKSQSPNFTFSGACNTTFKTLKNALDPRSWIKSYKNVRDIKEGIIDEDGTTLVNAASAKKIGYGILAAQAAFTVFMLGQWYFKAKTAINNARQTHNALSYLQTRLIDSATLIDVCKNCKDLAETSPAVKAGLVKGSYYTDLFKVSDNNEFGFLVNLLQSRTFKGQASVLSHAGRILVSYKLMKKMKDQFAPLIESIGELDACMSIAKLYKKSQEDKVNYCFAGYQEADNPHVALQGCWHPLIAPSKVVPNDVALGQNESAHNIILTGSNTGGKSTILKSILFSLLSAQTCTIAPAQKVEATPFSLLASYLHVLDDVAAGNSLFKAEVLRAQSLIDNAKGLSSNEFGFAVIDELFTGTAADKGAQAAYKVADYLTSMPNMVFILATHFPELTDLETATGGSCKNYKIDVIKKEDGTIVRPFKIEPGISTTSIANDILQAEMGEIDFLNKK